MKSIYLDNYRGFKDQLIPLLDVNFLVGENSTGKTSFLSVMKVLGSPGFWINPSFNDPDLYFSSFSEIVSKKSINKKSFTVGFIHDEFSEGAKNALKLLTFKNEEGLPVVHKYSFLCPLGVVTAIISDGKMKYKVHDNTDGDVGELLRLCISEHSISRPVGYRTFERKGLPKEILFANALHFVTADMAGKDLLTGQKKISFEINVDVPGCRWIAPIRAKPQKIYSSTKYNYSADGEHIPNILNMMLLRSNKGGRPSDLIKSLVKFGESSGLFQEVNVNRFGKEASSPFEVMVRLDGSDLLVGNVGYGVSQVLPIILEAKRKGGESYIAIQQPEVHLHPRAQAALGEFLFESEIQSGNNYIIETHSDYLIDRFRLCVNKSDKKPASQVLFFERGEKGNTVTALRIDDFGRYPEVQPNGFREFFINEELELLRL